MTGARTPRKENQISEETNASESPPSPSRCSSALAVLEAEWDRMQPGRYRTLTECDSEQGFYVGFQYAIDVLKVRLPLDVFSQAIEVLNEVALPPYPDSELSSLLETLRVRAKSVLSKLE